MTKNSKTLKTFEGFFHILYIPVVLVIRSSSFAPTPVPALPCHLPLPVPVLVPTCPCLPIALGLYYSYIKSTHQRLTYNAFRQEPNVVQHATINSQMVRCLHNKLSKTFNQPRDNVLHIDGPSTSQKARTRETRM